MSLTKASGKSLETWCNENGEYGELLKSEWLGCYDNGEPADIKTIAADSKEWVMWQCYNGHIQKCSVAIRTRNIITCSPCSLNSTSSKTPEEREQLKLINKLNTLGKLGKQIKSEWVGEFETGHPADITKVSYRSKSKAKWKCANGHIWVESISSRLTNRVGCPECRMGVNKPPVVTPVKIKYTAINYRDLCNNLGDTGKKILSEATNLDIDNNKIDINMIMLNYPKALLWRCEYGHEWYATPAQQLLSSGACKECQHSKSLRVWCQSNGVQGLRLFLEWVGKTADGKPIYIDEIPIDSEERLLWECPNGHVYDATIKERLINKRCPKCYNK